MLALKLFRSLGGWGFKAIALALLFPIAVSTGALAQTGDVLQTVSPVVAVIPQQVRYAGALPGRAGETVEAVFRIYATAEGGESLWTETQPVSVKADGSYSVVLGAATERGLPQAVFAAGQARWLGVTVDRAEGVRAPLSSVAYAMKAGDAETVGGLAAGNLATKEDLAKLASASAVPALPQIQAADMPTGAGTADYVPLWTSTGTLGNSGLYQAASGFFGIGTTTPGGPLQLSTGASGGANATMMLTQTSTASGNYYADIGLYNSKGLIGNLSALGAGYPSGNLFVANDVVFLGGQQNAGTNLIFLTNTSGALKFGTGGFAVSNERMRIGAAGGVSVGNSYVGTDPGAGNLIVSGKVGIGTTAPAALLEVNGTAKFDGLVTFASGQMFPGGGGAGTITGVTASSPLAGGGTSGTVTVGLNTSALEMTLNGVYAQLSAANNFADSVTFNGGLLAAMGKGTGYAAMTANGTNGSTGVYGASDTGYGVQGFSASGSGVYGSSSTGSGGSFTTAAENEPAVFAISSANITSGNDSPTALNATATGTGSIGVFGSGVQIGVYGFTPTTGAIASYAVASNAYAGYFDNNGTGYPTIYATDDSPGSATTNPTVFQALAGGLNAYGVSSDVNGNGGTAVYGESDGGLETGSGRSAVGVKGLAKGGDSNGMVADATGIGGYGLYAHASGAGDTTRYSAAGVYGLADTGAGVMGVNKGRSATYNDYYTANFAYGIVGGVMGDTSVDASMTLGVGGGVIGTADNNNAGSFINNSKSYATLSAYDMNSGGSTGLFKTFKASTPDGTCGIGDGDLSCTGQLKTLATTTGGTRTVETYAMQSPENWMEDFGTASLQGGMGVVQLEAAFADTVTSDASYHVFLTPRGDSKGLYVTNLTASSFEVRESGGGTSSMSFDYRIVAKRRGYEAERLVDVTDRFKAEQAETKRSMPVANTAMASQGTVETQMVDHPEVSTRTASIPRPSVRPAMGLVSPRTPVLLKKPISSPVVQK